MFKKVLAWGLIIALMVTVIPTSGGFTAYAASGLQINSETTVTGIEFQKRYKDYEVAGGNLVIKGVNLLDLKIDFEVNQSLEPSEIERESTSTEYSLRYNLDAVQARAFSGVVRINNFDFNLETTSFPVLNKTNKVAVNQDFDETIIFDGANLTHIQDADIVANFGTGNNYTSIKTLPGLVLQPEKMTFKPRAISELGSQNVSISKLFEDQNVSIKINNFYSDAFKIIEKLDVDPVTMFPNVGNKGDIITLASDSFKDSINYEVYFLDNDDGDYDLTSDNKSPLVKLSGDKKSLAVTVPTSDKFELGTKRVVIVNEKDGDVVARYDLSEKFNLIDASYSPIITIINPKEGSDEGANVQIKGKNIIEPVIPELNSSSGDVAIDSVSSANGNRDMIVNYSTSGLTYKGQAVTSIERTISTTIGNKTFNQVDGSGKIKYRQDGSDDYLFLKTDQVFDVDTDPVKDVVIEITTKITLAGGSTFVFQQSARKKDGYTFIKSSIEPEIKKVSPDKIQINPGKTLKQKSQISIEGDNFFVDKYTDEDGKVHTNYPVVTFQLTGTLGTADAVVIFDKNKGTITDANGVVSGATVDMTVLNKNGEVVDGSQGNTIGTRILLYIPEQVNVGLEGKKNVQVINTKRSSDFLGLGDVAIDVLDFIITDDSPVIESVKPDIITADSEEEITITGSNLRDGVKVYIDGVDVGKIERNISDQGDNVTLTFKAPVGRVGQTLIQVVNPSGGIAVRDFYYVQSYNQDPSIVAVAPSKGTTNTLVTIKGDNFLKPDAGVDSTKGLNGYKLIGTRVLLDGKDVNTYNFNSVGEISYEPYTAPDDNQPLFKVENNQVSVSPFHKNAVITSSDDSAVLELTFSSAGIPQFYDGNEVLYSFSVEGGNIVATNAKGDKHSVTVTNDSVTVNASPAEKFNVRMNNGLIRGDYNFNRELSVKLADYGNSVVLYDSVNKAYYTIQKQVDGTLKLTDGQNKVFTISAKGTSIDAPGIKAADRASNQYDVISNRNGFVINTPTPITLTMLTPFEFNEKTGAITGNRVEVISRDSIRVYIPALSSSTGYKDVTVVNPDTKSDTLKDGFYYYKLPATDPVISFIQPSLGSIDGGYAVQIIGKDFNDSLDVYFDGNKVEQSKIKVARDGKSIEVIVPAYPVDISERYGVGALSVPVVVVNTDGGSTVLEDGFTYVKPTSTPKIDKIRLTEGPASGGEVVEIMGEDFRFFEPYENLGGGTGYDLGIDTFTDTNAHLNLTAEWDNLLDTRYKQNIDLWEEKPMPDGKSYYGYDYYYDSTILPKVFFGTTRAKIVDFANGYIKVIAPEHPEGPVAVRIMNNDAGVSNTVIYDFQSSKPKIEYINPDSGRRIGNEDRDIVGSGFVESTIKTYINNDATTPVADPDVKAVVRFGAISNENIKIGQENDGRINANRATVTVEGGLTVSLNGKNNEITMTLQEDGKVYQRTFSGYTGGDIYLPTGMLKEGDNYYFPTGYGLKTSKTYNDKNDYELVKVSIDDEEHRLIVSRGYAPKAKLATDGRITVKTPAYYTIDKVPVTVYTPDGGSASTEYEYLNPVSYPVISKIKPVTIIGRNTLENPTDEEQRFVEGSIQGGISVEISGYDFRENVKVYFGTLEVEVIDLIKDKTSDQSTIIVKVPSVSKDYVNKKLPIIVKNTDGGIAVSSDSSRLVQDDRLIYFVYRKPASLPAISSVEPNKTSEFGGNTITIRGSDFRTGSKVIIGSVNGIPVIPSEIDRLGQYIKFQMPKNVPVGVKDIQVINSDFGTSTLDDSLTVISYPEVESTIRDEKGNTLKQVGIGGGDVIKLKGKHFQSGAVVIFGGTRAEFKEGMTGNSGYYKDDKTYVITDGVVSPKVEFIDENTLSVTTPDIRKELTYTITVINPDTGMSSGEQSITFGVPVPKAPKLKVVTVNDRYFKLMDFETEDTKYYEVFAFIGRKSIRTLMNNNYRDFKSLGTTDSAPYKVTNLKGLDAVDNQTKVFFVVKAVNEFGSSEYSNIAYVKGKDLKDFVIEGSIDRDGSIGVNRSQIYEKSIKGTKGSVMFTDERFSAPTTVDLLGSTYQNMTDFAVYMPDKMVLYNGQPTTVKSNLIDLTFTPSSFATAKFVQLNTGADEFAKLGVDYKENSETSSALGRLPWGTKPVSPVITFDYTYENGNKSQSIGAITQPMTASLHTASPKVTTKGGSYNVYFFDKGASNWRVIPSTYDGSTGDVTFSVQNQGFVVLTVQY